MPLTAKIAVVAAVAALLGGAVALIGTRGAAIILDLAAGAAAFICL